MRDYFSVFINNIGGAQLDIFFFQGVINIGEIIQVDIDNQPGGMRPPVYRTACGNIIDFLTALVLQGLYIEVAVYIAPVPFYPVSCSIAFARNLLLVKSSSGVFIVDKNILFLIRYQDKLSEL